MLPVHATIAIASLLRFAFGLVTALSKAHLQADASRAPSTSRSRLTASSKIETERLTLHRRRPDDAAALVAMHTDPAVTAWLARGRCGLRADARATIARFEAHSDARYLGDHLASRQGHALRTHVVVVACALTVRLAADLNA
ncbi:hypothetical protein [Burkholderia sp. 567]|uniref:GNAT family N-acetyltransferase n=1 Tax=Burkholderia sp. 567 TaxID=3156413 RepID=UPI00339AA803